MQGRTLLLILAAVAFSALGQLGLKSGARQLTGLGLLNLHVLAGLAAWSASTLCWIYVLRVAPLSRAYGLNALTYVLVPLASVWLFGEQLRRLHVVGMLLILLGVACVLWGD